MNYIITGKNIDITKALKDTVIQKLSKLEKYFAQDNDVHVTLSVEKLNQIIEVTIPTKGGVIRAEEEAENMYAAIDLVIDVLERQLLRHKHKLYDKNRSHSIFKPEFFDGMNDEEEETIKIVRTKKFAMKPMDAVEACLEMDLLGHDFFVFRNSETDEVNVVYKRKGGSYGLIEPEF